MFEQSEFLHRFTQIDPGFMMILIPFFLVVYFLPAILAVFFNRRHLTKIFLANIPAGLSWIAWVALIIWAITGKRKSQQEKKSSADQAV